MSPLPMPIEITDGVVVLTPLTPADAEVHLAGEDEELQRWLSGGVSTPVTVARYLEAVEERWRIGGPIFNFAVRVGAERALVGTMDVQLQQEFTREGQANLAYGLYPQWRGRGLATRAVELAIHFLRDHTTVTSALIRVDPLNAASAAVAIRSGFTLISHAGTHGELDRYERPVDD